MAGDRRWAGPLLVGRNQEALSPVELDRSQGVARDCDGACTIIPGRIGCELHGKKCHRLLGLHRTDKRV